MGAANVQIKEKDLSARVPASDGIYNAMLIRAKKGAINKPRLITGESDLLKYFTPNEDIKVGYDKFENERRELNISVSNSGDYIIQ